MFQKILIVVLAIFFTVAGAAHFVSPGIYLPMMPDYLPWHLALIYASGVAEMAGGIGICLPKWRRLAGWGLIALLLAVFPANIRMLTHHVPLNGKSIPEWILWVRLPLQALLVAWVYLSCVRRKRA